MDFLLTTDSNYLRYLYVVMSSVYVNHDWQNTELTFHILYNELSQDDINGVKNFAKSYKQQAFFYYIDNSLFVDFPIGKSWAISCMYILFAHKFLPETINRVLYLDIDLAVNGDLTEFYNLNFDDNYFIASKEWYNAKFEPKIPFEKFDAINNFDANAATQGRYLNSGVLLFNLEKFRSENIDLEFYKNKLTGLKNVFYDQGVICVCFAEKTKLLTTCKYNYRLGFSIPEYFNFDNISKNTHKKYTFYPIEAKIIHYCGFTGIKPWNLLLSKRLIPNADQAFFENVPENIDYCNIWWKYAKYTPKNIYNSLIEDAKRNTAAYQMLWGAIYYRGFNFHNLLKVDMLVAPNWRGRNSIISNTDLNLCIVPKIYICNASVKRSIKNLPIDFTEDCAFRLTVKQLSGDNTNGVKLLQILELDNQTPDVYRRHSNNNGKNWSKWQKLVFNDEILYLKNQVEFLTKELDNIKKLLLD